MFDVFRGFQIFIGEASEFAVMSDRSYILDTGRYTNMDISGKFVSKVKKNIVYCYRQRLSKICYYIRIYFFIYLLNNVFNFANKPNTKREISIKFQTKLVLFSMLP